MVYVKGAYVSSILTLKGEKLALCMYEGVKIIDKKTGDELKNIPKPKESKRFTILMQKIPDIDKNRFALWIDTNTLSFVDFWKNKVKPLALIRFGASWTNKQLVILKRDEGDLLITTIEWKEGSTSDKNTSKIVRMRLRKN